MSSKQWLRKLLGPRVQGSPAARRAKSRQPSRRDYVPRAELLEDRLAPAILTVTSLADSGAGTLRAAIQNNVSHTGGGTGNDTIMFSRTIDGGTIGLTTFLNDASVAGPSAFRFSQDDTLVIDGETGLTRGITIARASSTPFRIFYVYPTVSLTLKGLTLSGGVAQGGKGGDTGGGSGGGGGAAGLGGAIFNQGTVTIIDSTLTGNLAQGGNGGSAYSGSTAPGAGGGGMAGGGVSISRGIGDGGAGGPINGGPPNSSSIGGGSGSNGGFGGGGSGGYAYNIGFAKPGRGYLGGFGGGGGGAGEVVNSPGLFSDTLSFGNGGGSGGFGGGGGGGSAATGFPNPPAPGGYGGGFGGSGASRTNGGGGGGGGGAGMGGAVFNAGGTVFITNSTLTGNSANGGSAGSGVDDNNGSPGYAQGGALFSYNGAIEVTNSTFSQNTISSTSPYAAYQNGRDIFVLGLNGTAKASFLNTIIAQADVDVSDLGLAGGYSVFVGGRKQTSPGSVTVGGTSNLIRTISSSESVTNNLVGTLTANPKLGPLQNNGGLTPTMALQLDSLASGTGTVSAAPARDQRGVARGISVDIGAYEGRLVAVMNVNTTADEIAANGSLSLREAINLANGATRYRQLSDQEKAQITLVAGNVNTITFASSLNGGALTLSTVGDVSAGPSALLVSSPIIISGPTGNSGITLSAAGTAMRLFDVTSTGNLTLQNLTLSGGAAQGLPAAMRLQVGRAAGAPAWAARFSTRARSPSSAAR